MCCMRPSRQRSAAVCGMVFAQTSSHAQCLRFVMTRRVRGRDLRSRHCLHSGCTDRSLQLYTPRARFKRAEQLCIGQRPTYLPPIATTPDTCATRRFSSNPNLAHRHFQTCARPAARPGSPFPAVRALAHSQKQITRRAVSSCLFDNHLEQQRVKASSEPLSNDDSYRGQSQIDCRRAVITGASVCYGRSGK